MLVEYLVTLEFIRDGRSVGYVCTSIVLNQFKISFISEGATVCMFYFRSVVLVAT